MKFFSIDTTTNLQIISDVIGLIRRMDITIVTATDVKIPVHNCSHCPVESTSCLGLEGILYLLIIRGTKTFSLF